MRARSGMACRDAEDEIAATEFDTMMPRSVAHHASNRRRPEKIRFERPRSPDRMPTESSSSTAEDVSLMFRSPYGTAH